MEIEEYFEKERAIEEQAIKDKNCLALEYARSTSDACVGDTVVDRHGAIRVDNISFHFNYETKYPECVYEGACMTKQGQVDKNGEEDIVYQADIVHIAKVK